MPQLKTNTVTVTNGSNAVTGSGTTWLTGHNPVTVGAYLIISDENGGSPTVYEVQSIPSDTSITLTTPWAGTSGTYNAVIHIDFLPNGVPALTSGDLETVAVINRAHKILGDDIAAANVSDFVKKSVTGETMYADSNTTHNLTIKNGGGNAKILNVIGGTANNPTAELIKTQSWSGGVTPFAVYGDRIDSFGKTLHDYSGGFNILTQHKTSFTTAGAGWFIIGELVSGFGGGRGSFEFQVVTLGGTDAPATTIISGFKDWAATGIINISGGLNINNAAIIAGADTKYYVAIEATEAFEDAYVINKTGTWDIFVPNTGALATRASKSETALIAETSDVVLLGDIVGLQTSGAISGSRLGAKSSTPVLVLQDSDSTGSAQSGYISLQDSSGVEQAWLGFGDANNDDFAILNSYGNIKALSTFHTTKRAITSSDVIDASYTNAAIEIREPNLQRAGVDNWANAPRLTLHWGDRAASQIGLSSNGTITFLDGTAANYEDIQAQDAHLSSLYATNNVSVDGTTFWKVSASDDALQRFDARSEDTDKARLHCYGQTSGGTTSNFRQAWYDGSNYIDVTSDDRKVKIANGSVSSEYGYSGVGNSSTKVLLPNGGVVGFSDTSTGAIKIALPVTWTNTMLQFTVDVFNYSTGKTFQVKIAGYNYAATGEWYNTTATIVGGTEANVDHTVRFGHDGSKCCVYIGETNTAWPYLHVGISDVQVSYTAINENTWNTGWRISIVTSFGTITSTRGRTQLNKYVDGSLVYHSGNAGTAVTHDVTESLLDTTAGRLLKVGDANILTNSAPRLVATSPDTLPTGFWSYNRRVDGATPPSWVPSDHYSWCIPFKSSAGALNWGMVYNVNLKKLYLTSGVSDSVWYSAPKEIYHSGSILGPVSQSGGVPTGAVIERGSNVNGEYVKFADGTMICTHQSATSYTTSAAKGSLFYNNGETFTFPAVFISSPVVTPNLRGGAGNAAVGGYTFNLSTTGVRIGGAGAVNTDTFSPGYIAVGRWY